MAADVSFGDLKTRSLRKADMFGSEFIETTTTDGTPSELEDIVNGAISETYDLLVSTFDDEYFFKERVIPSVNGQFDYKLPSDFYKLVGMDVAEGFQVDPDRRFTVEKFNYAERNTRWTGITTVRGYKYRILGDKFRVIPRPDQNGLQFFVSYIPAFIPLTADKQTFNGVNGFEKLVVLEAAIQMLLKEESPIADLQAERDKQYHRVEGMAANRDAHQPSVVQDVDLIDDGELWLWGQG